MEPKIDSREFMRLADTNRGDLIKMFTAMIIDGRMTQEEFDRFNSLMERVVYAERMALHRLYDECR